MDFMGDLNGMLGVSGPQYILIGALVALLLGFSLAFAVLEAIRIYREYPVKEKPQTAAVKPVVKPMEKMPEPEKKLDITKLAHIKPEPPVPAVEVVKPTLPESMKAVTGKYRLDSLTLASFDGLVIASNSKTPEEDAAVYSNLFQELYRSRPGPYFNVANKDIHLLLVESDSQKFIAVARKPGQAKQDEISGLIDDCRKIVEKFSMSGKRS